MAKLIICLDGLGFDKISRINTPFLYEFSRKNHIARLKTLFAFTGIEVAFFSGKNPEKSNTWLEFVYSPKTSPFKWQKYFLFLGRKAIDYSSVLMQYLGGRNFISKTYHIPYKVMGNFDISTRENIWQLNVFNNKKFICYKFPFFVKNNKIKIIPFYESDGGRCNRLVKSINKETEIYAVQLLGIDKASHKYGSNNYETLKRIKELDKLIEKTVYNFKRRIPDLDIVLWSDHGFLDIKRYVNLEKMLPKSKDYVAFYGGTTASFWFKNENIKKEVIGRLKKFDFGHILAEKEKIKYKMPLSMKHGEIIFAVNPGIMIFPNYYEKTKEEKFKAMHGYTHSNELDGIFITNIKCKKKVLKMCEVKTILNDKSMPDKSSFR